MKAIYLLVLLGGLSVTACAQNYSTFQAAAAPDKVKGFAWAKLMEDAEGDGKLKDSADGKALHFYYEKEADTLWFRLDLFSALNQEAPAISLSFDTDADQSTGIPWYGRNRKFTFEKMLSVGPVKRNGAQYEGYNGVTNMEGVKTRNWINEKQGVAQLYFDTANQAYIVGVKRADIAPGLKKINVIGSVGQNALWNDDIGEEGFATIEFTAGGARVTPKS